MNISAPQAAVFSVSLGSRNNSADHLASMRSSLDTASAIGNPRDFDSAQAALSTGSDYVKGAGETLAALDQEITQREERAKRLAKSDPESASHEQSQVMMLTMLRDRIALSMERVSKILFADSDTQITNQPAHTNPPVLTAPPALTNPPELANATASTSSALAAQAWVAAQNDPQ